MRVDVTVARAALATLVALCGAAAANEPAGGAHPAAIETRIDAFLVRHAETSSDPQDPGLSPKGAARAWCLAEALGDEAVTHVFTSPWRRARETAGPAAAARGLEAIVRDPMKAKDLAAEIAALPAGSRVLVVGHSNTIPLLAKALGVELEGLVMEAGQPAFPRSEHDRLVEVSLVTSAAGDRRVGMKETRLACAPADAP